MLNYYYDDGTHTSVSYAINWTYSQSQSIDLSMVIKENTIKVGQKSYIELKFVSTFTKPIQICIRNKDFNFSFSKCNYLVPYKTENELKNIEAMISNNNTKLKQPLVDFNFFNTDKCAEILNYGVVMFMKDHHY